MEEAINEKLIPDIIGCKVSDIYRKIFALLVRHGGLGITNPVINADHEFEASRHITKNLSTIIYNQEKDFTNLNEEQINNEIKLVKDKKEERISKEMKDIMTMLDEKSKRNFKLAQDNGAGSWLNVPPIYSLEYTLNKQQFRDSLRIRYGWPVPGTPTYCQCKQKNNIDHTLNCKLGGYVHMRHNKVRDFLGNIMREVYMPRC